MDIQVWQIILLGAYVAFAQYDGLNPSFGFVKAAVAGGVAGLILGDPVTGLYVGGTLNLLSLGVASFGGAAVPDYCSGAVLGTAFAIMSGKGAEFGIGLAIPISLLLTQLDILARFSNTFFQQKANKYIKEGNIEGVERMNLMGNISWSLSRFLPVTLGLLLGSELMQVVVDYIPQWLMGGLKTAGGIIPALGIAILLKYLPVKRYVPYLLLGFVLAAYLNVPMLGIAIIGFAGALYAFTKKDSVYVANTSGGADEDE